MASKRTRRSVLLALAAFLLLVAGIGLTVASPTGVPSEMSVPLPRVGDKLEYSLTIVEGSGNDVRIVQEESLLYRFEWKTPRTVLDFEGEPHRVNQLHEFPYGFDDEGVHQRFADDIYGLDVETGAMIVSTRVNGGGGGSAEHQTDLHNEQDRFHLMCGIQNKLQGRTTDLRGDVDLFRACSYEDYWSPYGDGFHALGTETIGGYDTVFFTKGTRASLHQVHAWMSEDLPYPVRLTVQDQDDGSRYHVIRLTAYEPGTTAIETAAGHLPPKHDLPPLDLVQVGRYGPDDSGLQVPWKLRDAVDAALAAPEADDLRAFVEQHPDWLVGAAQMSWSDNGQTESVAWLVTVADGRAWKSFASARHVGPVPATLDIGGIPVPLPVGDQPGVRYVYTSEDHPTPADAPWVSYPRTGELPVEGVPTLPSVAARWSLYAGESYRERPANAWRFDYLCHQNDRDNMVADEDDCLTSAVRMSVGMRMPHESDVPTEASMYQLDNWFGPWEAEISEYYVPGAAPDGLRPTPNQDLAVASASDSEVALWSFPPGYLLGAGLLVLLGSALYGLWPKLAATGAIGLFSRIEGPELLEHPLRRALHQAVEANPGVHAKELARIVGQPRGTVDHHIRKLVAAELLTLKQANGYSCLFVAGTAGRAELAAAPFVRAPGARRILEEVVRGPGRSSREIGLAAGLAPSVVSYHVHRLGQAGLLRTEKLGAALRLHPTELGQKAAPDGAA